jgi:transcriptional regulator with XRE-family HTH domain
MQQDAILLIKEVHLMSIGGKIKSRRIELQWSQRELSDKMGYSNHSTIARIESGTVDIPQSKIVKFAEVLGVSISYLMDWEEENKKTANKHESGLCVAKQELLALVENCSDEEASRLLQMMELFLGKQ